MLSSLKQYPCVRCGMVGTLNRHDTLWGYDPASADKRIKRGRRAWCSNKGRRGGCGRTMAIRFAWVLPRHILTAPLLEGLLACIADGCSLPAAWERSRNPLPLDTAYHLLQRLTRRLDAIRASLRTRSALPRARGHPVRRTAALLRHAFPGTECVVSRFQHVFQTAILG